MLLWKILFGGKRQKKHPAGFQDTPQNTATQHLENSLNVTWCYAVSILSAWAVLRSPWFGVVVGQLKVKSEVLEWLRLTHSIK
jgi:hypothetical protein